MNPCAGNDDGTPMPGRSGQMRALFALNALYIGFGAVMGTVQGGLPPVLRQQGYDVGAVGWIYAFYLPFGLSFLWAHYIDRARLPFLGRRTGWIVTMQAIAVSAILLLALGSSWPVVLLVALGFTVTLAIATMDTALDALAVEQIDPDKRPLASGLKLAALSVGAMIGNGAFVIFFSRFGWAIAFLSLAGLMLLLAVPILTIRESGRMMPETRTEQASLMNVLCDMSRRTRLFLITVVSCVIFPLAGLNRIMLVDIGVPLGQIGWIVGTLGPISMLLVAFAAMALMSRASVAATFSIFGILGVLSVGLLSGASIAVNPPLAIAGSILTGAAVSGIYVTLMAKIIGWSAGNQPATDYAAYYGISRLASTILTIAAAQLVAWADWSIFYGLGAAVLMAVLLFSSRRIFRSET